MDASQWIAFGTLAFAVLAGGASVIALLFNSKSAILEQSQKNKEEIETELSAIRMAAYEEYKTLRSEMAEASTIARREFGETVHSIREKINQVEFWVRDHLAESTRDFYKRIDFTRSEILVRVEKQEERVRQLELFTAREMGRKDPT